MALAHPHAPSHGINTWRDFFVHIAVVAIGLLLALGLEQTVEYVHHRHQRAQFEEQMAETFRVNSRIDEDTFAALANIREYLVGLQNAVLARREGRVMLIPDAPPYTYLTLPTLGPYEAAQANGTLGLLPVDRIRLFQRIAFQHDIAANDLADYRHAVRALRAFRKRFDPSPAYDGRLLFMIPAADIDRLTPQEQDEYRTLIAATLESIDQLVIRMKRLQIQSEAILNGARDETDLLKAITTDLQDQR